MHLLPEAFESQAGAHELFATLLVGLVFFFLLDKAELWHHGHEHGVGPANDDPGTGEGTRTPMDTPTMATGTMHTAMGTTPTPIPTRIAAPAAGPCSRATASTASATVS